MCFVTHTYSFMSFVGLKGERLSHHTRHKERISLLIMHSTQSYLVFYNDGFYQHLDPQTDQLIHQDKLNFAPSLHLPSRCPGRAVVLGCDHAGHFFCAVIAVDNHYRTTVRQIGEQKPELTTKYHLLEPESNKEEGILLVMVMKDVQNGIALTVYDYGRDIWSVNMMALSSKFLNYSLVDCCPQGHLFAEKNEAETHAFALVALGDRFDSLNYAKVKVALDQTSGTAFKNTLVISREVKLNQHFVVLGGALQDEHSLFLVGNARVQGPGDKVLTLPATMSLSTVSLDSGDPQPIDIIRHDFALPAPVSMQLMRVVACIQGNIFVSLSLPNRQTGIARLTPHCADILIALESRAVNLQASLTHDSLWHCELECEQFFEKMKSAVSKVGLSVMRIEGKALHYRKLMKSAYPQHSHFFANEVVALLSP